MPGSATSPFVRDRFTWLAYFMLAYYAYLQAALGPLMPFLRDERRLSYTVAGLHFSAFALGMVLAGTIADGMVRRWGRTRIFWGGGIGMGAGALLLVFGRQTPITIAASFLMGFPGSLLLVVIQAALSDRYQEQRAIALTESNVVAVIFAGLAPLLIGSLQRAGVGWRAALIVAVVAWGGLAIIFRRDPIPRAVPDLDLGDSRAAPNDQRLPPLYWAYWIALFLGVSVEWSIVFWGADFLENTIGLSRVNASSLMSMFFLAAVIGRAVGSYLTRVVRLGTLLLIAVGVAMVGFVFFWLVPGAALSVGGLFVAGLGVSNLFPLCLSAATGAVAPAQTDAASGRISLGAGLAILITPQVLGSLADQIGIQSAYAVAGGFLLITALAIGSANRMADRQIAPQVQTSQD